MEPAHIILSPDGKTAYATNGGDSTVTVIDVDSMTALATIPVGGDILMACAQALMDGGCMLRTRNPRR